MSRKIRDVNLETATARRRLKVRSDPYWRILSIGKHLGYRRNKGDEGAWLERRYVAGRYVEGKLAAADDIRPSNGVSVLNFFEAQEAARARWQEIERQQLGGDPSPGRLTVRAVLGNYFAHREQRGSRGLSKDKSAAEKRIIPTLGNVDASKLTSRQIADWHTDLAATNDVDRQRAKRATANRVLTILKASLNHAFRAGLLLSDVPWRQVQPFHNVDKPGTRFLSAAETQRLINSCTDNFRDLVQGALLTGARFGELVRMRISDLNYDTGTVFIEESKSGRSRHVVLSAEALRLFSALRSKARSIKGYNRDHLLFARNGRYAWGPSQQVRRMEAACKLAGISPPLRFHDLRHCYASQLAMGGAPLAVISQQLGHADGRMSARYAHFSPSYLADAVREAMPTLGIVVPDTPLNMVAETGSYMIAGSASRRARTFGKGYAGKQGAKARALLDEMGADVPNKRNQLLHKMWKNKTYLAMRADGEPPSDDTIWLEAKKMLKRKN